MKLIQDLHELYRSQFNFRWGSGKPHDLARSSVDEGCIVSNRVFTTPSTQRGHVPSLFSFFALRAFLQTVRVYLAAIKKMKSLHVTAARNHALKRCGGDWGAETPYRHETSCMKPWYGKKIAWISMHEHAAWRWFLGSKIEKPFNARLLGQSLEVIHHQPHLSLYRLFWQVGCQLSKNLKQTIVVHWLRRGNHCHGYEHPRMCTNCFFAKLVASEIKLRTQNYSCVTPSYKKTFANQNLMPNMSNEILLVANSSNSFAGATAKDAFCNSSMAAHACCATSATSAWFKIFFDCSLCAPHAGLGLRDGHM